MILKDKGILQRYETKIYPVVLIVAIGDLENEVNKFYKPYEPEYNWISKPKKISLATVYRVTNKKTKDYGLLVWFPTMDNYSAKTLCHESGHVALEIFARIKAEISIVHHEPFCYLLGYIAKCINTTYYNYREYLDRQKENNNPKE